MPNVARHAPNARLQILFVELGERVEAYYNPKEIAIDRQVPWSRHKSPRTDLPRAEFTGAEPRSMTLELFFDTYESGESVYSKYLAKLEKGAVMMEQGSGPDRRPPTCLVTWGNGFPKFVGVIESLSVKYTMFFNEGTPCRATAAIKLKEVPRGRR